VVVAVSVPAARLPPRRLDEREQEFSQLGGAFELGPSGADEREGPIAGTTSDRY
jgi:hypothetical protein